MSFWQFLEFYFGGTHENGSEPNQSERVLRWITFALLIAAFAVFIYGLTIRTDGEALWAAAIALLWSLAALALGAFFGLLFGVPIATKIVERSPSNPNDPNSPQS